MVPPLDDAGGASGGDAFGGCCEDLRASMGVTDATDDTFTSHFLVSDEGVFFLSVGHLSGMGPGVAWFDQAVLFCPFCGTKLQDKDELATRLASGEA